MSRESHRKYLENAALREAQKAIARKGRENFSRDELLRLRIQIVEPWKRIVLGLLGLVLSGISIASFLQGPSWAGYLVAAPAIEIVLPAGVVVRLPGGTDPVELARLVAELGARPC